MSELGMQPQELTQGAGQEDSPLGLPNANHPMLQGLNSVAQEWGAKFDQLKQAQKEFGAIRTALDSLVKLGDTVTQDDVVKQAGGLVAAGMKPSAIAGLLADMPEQGEALQAWIAQQDQQVRLGEAYHAQALGAVRHTMGVAALRALMGHAAMPMGDEVGAPGPKPGPVAPGPKANPLMMGGSDAD